MTATDQQALQIEAKDPAAQPPTNIVSQSYFTFYCRCKGQVQQEFMVACEVGEDLCPNKGWLHPQCTDDLKDMSKEEIDKIDIWYCMDCRKKHASRAANTMEKRDRALLDSPQKSSTKRGSIGLDNESADKKEKMSCDSLKKSLIIKLTADAADEPCNLEPPGANQKSSGVPPAGQMADRYQDEDMELEANEQLIEPRLNLQKKSPQPTFQISQTKQAQLDGFRGDGDWQVKHAMKNKQQSMTKAPEKAQKGSSQQ